MSAMKTNRKQCEPVFLLYMIYSTFSTTEKVLMEVYFAMIFVNFRHDVSKPKEKHNSSNDQSSMQSKNIEFIIVELL